MIFSVVLVACLLWPNESAAEVSKSPKILDSVDRLNYPEGTNATLTCSIASGELDGLTYQWLRDDRKIAPSTRTKISIAPENFNSILRIIDLKANDSGSYSCVASNRYGQDKISIQLFVKDVEVPASKPVYVPCTASGQPEPRTEWFKVSSDGSSQHMGPELRFSSISPNDAGDYECMAKNGVEKDLISRIKISVLGK